MSAFTEKRNEVQAELAALSRTLHEQLVEAGRTIVTAKALPDEEPYATLIARDAEITSRLAELQAAHERIVSIGDRLTELGTARDELEKRRKEIAGELEPHYRTIGENAFRVFRDNPLVDQEYADIFTPVLDAAAELKQTQAELQRAEAEIAEKPFLEKMVLRGRIIVLRNRFSLRETQIERLYADAGRQIAGTDFITTIGDPGLDEAAAPFLDLMDEMRRVEQEVSALDDEREELGGELAGLGVDRRPSARINEIDREIEQTQQERAKSLAEIATAAKGSDLAEELGSDVVAVLDGISETEAELETLGHRMERLEAAIEVERLNGDIDQLDSTIERKRGQVAALTSDIDELEKKKASVQTKVKEGEKRRGAVEDLLA